MAGLFCPSKALKWMITNLNQKAD